MNRTILALHEATSVKSPRGQDKLAAQDAADTTPVSLAAGRNRIMVELTDEQRKVMFQLGRTDSVFESVPKHVLDQLVQMGLLYYRSEKNICFTNEGQRIYQQLKKWALLA